MTTTEQKKADLLEWLRGCGYSETEAARELSAIVKYHTTGVDAVSYDYAIAMIWDDLEG